MVSAAIDWTIIDEDDSLWGNKSQPDFPPFFFSASPMGSNTSNLNQPSQLKKLKHTNVSIDFLHHPRHLQLQVLQKLNSKNVVNIALSSKATLSLVDSLKPNAIHEVFAIGFKDPPHLARVCTHSENATKDRIKYDRDLEWLIRWQAVRVIPQRVIIEAKLDDDNCQKIICALDKIRATILSLQCPSTDVTCRPELFAELLQKTRVSGLHCYHGIDWIYLQLNALDRLVVFDPRVYNETLLFLGATVLYLNGDSVTVPGLNRFLAGWKEGEREINILRVFNRIDHVETLLTAPIDLKAKKAWTKMYNRGLGNLRHWKWNRPDVVYKIKRSTDDTFLFVAIWKQQVKVIASNYIKKSNELCFESTAM